MERSAGMVVVSGKEGAMSVVMLDLGWGINGILLLNERKKWKTVNLAFCIRLSIYCRRIKGVYFYYEKNVDDWEIVSWDFNLLVNNTGLMLMHLLFWLKGIFQLWMLLLSWKRFLFSNSVYSHFQSLDLFSVQLIVKNAVSVLLPYV